MQRRIPSQGSMHFVTPCLPPTLPGHKLEWGQDPSALHVHGRHLSPSTLSFLFICIVVIPFPIPLYLALLNHFLLGVSHILHRIRFCFVNESINFILLKQLLPLINLISAVKLLCLFTVFLSLCDLFSLFFWFSFNFFCYLGRFIF